MLLVFWLIIFLISLVLMVKGADWLLASAEKIGLAIGFSPFIIGVTIVGVGTSFPELISSFVAVLKGVTEIPAANIIGSNIFNILFIVGFSAIIARKLVVTKSLIDLDLPLLAISTVILLGVAWDRQITFWESILLVVSYGIYLLYTIFFKEEDGDKEGLVMLPSRQTRRKYIITPFKKQIIVLPKLIPKDFFILIIGIIALVLGAKYLVDSVVKLSGILNIGVGVITIFAVAAGTSLPELLVSVKAALQKKSEIALGNIFGSNVFNALMILGFCGLFKTLSIDQQTFAIGLPTVALATLLFVISGISRRIHIWEGALYIVVYILFVAKLFNLF